MEGAIGAPLLPELRMLYSQHDGTPEAYALAVRTMPSPEVAETDEAIRRARPGLLSPGAVAFWTDDESNYAGCFLSGDLAGRVFTLDHELPVPTPAFFGVRSFLAALLDDPEAGWPDPDYPVVDDRRGDRPEADRALGHQFLGSYLLGSADEASLAAFAVYAIALIPPEDTERLVPLLESRIELVQARAARVLGVRRHEPALASLVELARRGGRLARVNSLLALRRLRGPEVAGALALLENELGAEYSLYFRP